MYENILIIRCHHYFTLANFLSFEIHNGQILVSGLYTDSSNTSVREAAYKLFLYPDKQQDYLLVKLLNCRHQLAQICGFPTYVHR